MKSIQKGMIAIVLLLSTTISIAQIKNAKTETVTINGNCGMCKKTIEKAGNIKDISEVKWDSNSKLATITYDETKTNPDAILKKIALSGYESEKYLASEVAYNKLPNCCQYERNVKTEKANVPELKTKQCCSKVRLSDL
jgi:copper chaperone CopZ